MEQWNNGTMEDTKRTTREHGQAEFTELARAKKLELGWLGSARRQSQNPSLARLGLEQMFDFRAELDSGSKKN